MPWIAGQQLQSGKYVIETVLGQGGFGITYKALHVELNQTVVIKTPHEYLSQNPKYKKDIDRFIKEGRTLASLSKDPHPHIVGVIDLFREGATHCLVMDFVEGENLFEAVERREALPEAEILPCICQIGEALSVVHQAGLVHRDVHPGNIMVRSNGKAVLIDFGIAKQVVPSTMSSINMDGHEAFAPYERKKSGKGSREPTVDIYSLAATLYYAVTGVFPTPSLDRKLDNASLIPPKQINPSISEQLNQAILKGMALEAKDRPQSMQLWLAMLEPPKAIPTPPVEPVYRKDIWLAMLEAPKATPPPKVETVHKTEVVRPKAKSKSKASNKPARTIPWGWLTFFLILYGLMGYLLALSNTSLWVVAGAVAVAVIVAVVVTGVVTGVVAVIVTGIVAWAIIASVAVAGVVAGIVAVAVAWAGGWVGYELRKSFSEIHTFLILASTSNIGLGLGWLGHRIFNTGS